MLLEHAGISADIWIVGLSDHLEVWSRERWEEFNEKLTTDAIVELGRETQDL